MRNQKERTLTAVRVREYQRFTLDKTTSDYGPQRVVNSIVTVIAMNVVPFSRRGGPAAFLAGSLDGALTGQSPDVLGAEPNQRDHAEAQNHQSGQRQQYAGAALRIELFERWIRFFHGQQHGGCQWRECKNIYHRKSRRG